MICQQRTGYAWACASLLLGSLAQVLMKIGMLNFPKFSGFSIQSFWEYQQAIIWVISGLIAYVFSLATWLNTLRYLPLNKAYPLLSLSYIVVYLIAINLPVLNETSYPIHWIGIGFIIAGVLCINWPSPMRRNK